MSEALPPLPEPDSECLSMVDIDHPNYFTADQMGEYGALCARQQAERDAAICQKVSRYSTRIDGTSFYIATGQCAAAILAALEDKK